jgi:hypothetical protein
MKSEVVGKPSVVSDDLVQSVDQEISGRQHFTISEFSCEFPQVSLTVLFKIITVKLCFAHHGFQKCSQLCTKHREWFLSLIFLE